MRAARKVCPEVATALPAVSRNGKTYTFTLKKTFKFADGTPVTAKNFAYAMNRDLQPKMSSPAIDFMADIAGAQAVMDGKAQTASGIKALSNTKLRITLTKVAPDFLARITMPFFSAVKTDTPINPDGVSAPSKGTACGPYYVSEWVTEADGDAVAEHLLQGWPPGEPGSDQLHHRHDACGPGAPRRSTLRPTSAASRLPMRRTCTTSTTSSSAGS